MKKLFVLILICLAIYTESYCQFEIKQIDSKGEWKILNNDSILSIPFASFDSIVIDNLEIPYDIENKSRCGGCRGSIFTGFMVYKKELIGTKILRGIEPKFDSILLQENIKILNLLLKYSRLKMDEFYYIIIPIKYWTIDDDQTSEKLKIVEISGVGPYARRYTLRNLREKIIRYNK